MDYLKKWVSNNPEKCKEYKKRYREKNRELIREKNREIYRKNNPKLPTLIIERNIMVSLH